MKLGSTIISLIFASVSMMSSSAQSVDVTNLDLEMSSRELSKIYQNLGYTYLLSGPLDVVVSMGQRNLQWLDYMNQSRDAAHKLHLTKRGGLIGYPIDSPRAYNQETVLADYNQALQDMPAEMKAIIIDGKPLTQTPPLDEASYIDWAFKIDRIYQLGVRFLLMKPYLNQMISRKQRDVRGIYFLSKDADLSNTLAGWGNFPEDKKAQYRDWLLTTCYNDWGMTARCSSDLKQSETQGLLFQFFQKHKTAAQKTWNDYFSMPATRTDIVWSRSQPDRMTVPFINPNDSRILSFLKDNIEEEWQNSNWKLQLNFVNNASEFTTPHVVFEPGVTPNVNTLAGNIITMDQNAPIDDWDVQWTIRHEFGHVLGFADCYLEYYEPSQRIIVSYQLDITNLMCSRRGVFQPLHFDQLKQAYYR